MEQFKTITAMVECPQGYHQKFDFDPATNRLKLSKILPAGMVFPFDFGMIPGTKGEDGDPLDIIVIAENATFPGCLIDCRIIGALQAEQTEKDGSKMRNDRFLGVPLVSELFKDTQTITDLPEGIIDQLEQFFVNYNGQAGKTFKVISRLPAGDAVKLLA